MKKVILFLGIVVFLSSCRPVINLDRPGDYAMGVDASGTINFPLEFKSFWSGMNHYYLYWDIDPTNWDQVYDEYQPKFEALGVMDYGAPDMETATGVATGYIKEMTKNLSDGHFGIFLSGETSAFQPAFDRVRDRSDYSPHDVNFFNANWTDSSDNWFESFIKPKLTDTNWFPKVGDVIPADQTFKAATGHYPINGGPGYILYFYFNAFSLSAYLADTDYGPVINQFLDELVGDSDVKGVIFDLRGNTGGSASDISLILSPFLTEPLKIAETRTKNGPGRLDYTPWGPFTIHPVPDESSRVRNPNIPVVALVNEFSISCGEITPMAIREMPNGHVMGKRTYGATGPRLGNDNPIPMSGGSFKNGYLVMQATYAGYATRSVHGENFEGIGVPVDEELLFGEAEWTQFTAGADPWLEAAVEHIKSKQP